MVDMEPSSFRALAFTAAVVVALIVFIRLRWRRIVPSEHVDLVERLGRYHRTLGPGRHMLVPSVDAVRARVDLRPQALTFRALRAITADNLLVSADIAVGFQIVDPVRATYEISDFRQALHLFTLVTLRNIASYLTQKDALSGRDEIERSLTPALDTEAARRGIKVNRAEVTVIEPASSVK